ncbi:MAG TPA: F0F1 ATP synthase subunit A [Candidatus Saccharimonadales bacterium]|nr:F0F1 ATP synthase subunit A [Candidatus Saccharimonadales bacterium]
MNLLARFAEDSGPAVHIAPGGVFHLGGLTITNSIFYGWICIAVMIIVLVAIARRVTVKPQGGLVQFIEMGIEFMTGTVKSGFTVKEHVRKYTPYFVTLFFFLLINNWLGLLPGVGEALTVHGVPLLRPFTGDFNGTLAVGVVTMLVVYGSSIRESGGLLKYLRHFFVGSPLNPLYLVIGILEMITDLMRAISLALRLFLNVTIGETIIAIFSYLGHTVAAPITAAPFTLIELFVGALQAYIFATLSIMYLASVANHAEHEDLTEVEAPGIMGASPAGSGE